MVEASPKDAPLADAVLHGALAQGPNALPRFGRDICLIGVSVQDYLVSRPSFELAESLPKSATGKVMWRQLQEQESKEARA